MKKIIIIFISMVLISSASASASSTDAIVKGFAKYQADRVESIALNEVLLDLKENRYFKQLFPLTNTALNSYSDVSGKRLIPLMQHFIEDDMEAFERFSKCIVLSFYEKAKNIKDINMLTHKGRVFYDELNGDFKKVEYTVSNALGKISNCKKEPIIIDEIYVKIKKLTDALRDSYINESNEEIKAKYKRKYDFWKNTYDYIEYVKSNKTSNYIKMHYLALSFEKLGISDGKVFLGFKKVALFLAELSDVAKQEGDDKDASEAVAAVIKNFVDSENDPFNEKRAEAAIIYDNRFGGFNWPSAFGIGSYFGVGLSSSDEDKYRSYGPVGVEVSLFAFSPNLFGIKFDDSRLFLGFAPFDLGIPIQNELTEKEYSASFQDIRSNSVYLSWSYGYKPYAILLSYHPDDTNRTGRDDSTIMLSFAFDLPLYF